MGPPAQGSMTLPIKDIDLDSSMLGALPLKVETQDHIEHASAVAFAAVGFAGECMANAMGELALRIDAGGTEQNFGGWHIAQKRNISGNAFSMVITRRDTPGAWHLGVQFDAVHSKIGAQRLDEMHARRGPESMDDRIRRILNPDPDETLFEADPENFRSACSRDHIKTIVGTALKAGFESGLDNAGPPPRVPTEESMALVEFMKDPLRFDGRWPGIALTIKPTRKAQNHHDHTKWKTGCGGGREAHCFLSLELLMVVSDIIKDAGLAEAVHNDFNEMMPRKLWSSSVADGLLREEVGIAAIRDSGGVVTQHAQDIIAQFTARLTARMVKTYFEGIEAVCRQLYELGYKSKSNAYVCSESKAKSYSLKDDKGFHLFMDTNSGRFRLDLNPSSGEIRAWKLSAPSRIIGSFITRIDQTSVGTERHVEPSETDVSRGQNPVEYTQANIWAFNEMIASICSICSHLRLDYPDSQYVLRET